jgi:lipopolysaccharide export system protein LptA
MALSIKRLRWVLAAAVLLLLVVLVAYIGYGRYLAMRIYTNLLHHAGATISKDTNGITYSQSKGGRTIFVLHAKTATQIGDGKYDLHGVNVTLYSRDGKHTDYITGDEFTYDEKEGIVKAIGEVHMDLVAPQSLTAGHSSMKSMSGEPASTNKESGEVIHVRTSGLEYLKKLGVATTKEQVEFHYSGIECTAMGAEFDTDESTLRLLSNVVAHGVLHGQPVIIHATTAEVDRTANIATLTQTVAESKGRTASADRTLLDLRKDGSIAAAKSTGHVLLTGKTQKVTSQQLDATFTTETVPQTARLSGGVQLTDSNALRPVNGSAAAVDFSFDAKGQLTNLSATGAPHMTLVDKRTLDRGLQREMHGDHIVAQFVQAAKGAHTESQLSELHATGSAEARGESLASGAKGAPKTGLAIKKTTLTADDLDLTFTPQAGKSEPQKLLAQGHTVLRQEAPAGELETSAGDRLDAAFTQATTNGKTQLALASAVQTGHVVVHRAGAEKAQAKGGVQQQIGDATAEKASYDGASEKLTLTGKTHLTQDNATITATTVVLDDRTQDADAMGNVQATLVGAVASASRAATYTHVLAASAHFTHASNQAEFYGTDAQPAKMWQDASQVQAATLLMDNVKKTFAARGAAANSLIHAVFAGASTPSQNAMQQKTPGGAGRTRYVRVASAKMDYSDTQREAVFSGPQGVTMEADAGTIKAQRAVAYLAAAGPKMTGAAPSNSTNSTPFNGSLDHIVITGEVQLDQPGRHGTGEQLVYTAATGDSVLTGSPGVLPKIVDAQQGSITGASLLFGDAGSTIIVTGESGPSKPTRVHTETHIDPKSDSKSKEERQ